MCKKQISRGAVAGRRRLRLKTKDTYQNNYISFLEKVVQLTKNVKKLQPN